MTARKLAGTYLRTSSDLTSFRSSHDRYATNHHHASSRYGSAALDVSWSSGYTSSEREEEVGVQAGNFRNKGLQIAGNVGLSYVVRRCGQLDRVPRLSPDFFLPAEVD